MKKIFILALLLVIGIYLSLHYFINQWVRGQYTPENYALMRECLDNTLDAPPEWFAEVKYGQELIEQGNHLDIMYDNLDLQVYTFDIITKILQGDPIKKDEWIQIHQDVASMRDYTDKLIAYTQRPDYELSALVESPSLISSTEKPNYLMLQIASKALQLRTYSTAKTGTWREAFEANLASHRMTQRRSNINLISHLIAVAIQEMSCHYTAWLIQRCDDDSVLSKAFDELKALDQKVNLNALDHILALNIITRLHSVKKDHPGIDMTPGKTGYFYFQQLSDYSLEEMKKMPKEHYTQTNLPSATVLSMWKTMGFGKQVTEMIFSVSMPNILNARFRERNATARYQAMLLSLASKLYQMNKGVHPQKFNDLMPDYFEEEIYDPFVEDGVTKPYAFDASKKMFYSIGPDKKDDLNKIPYDPSNGLISRGDISTY